MSKKIEVLTPIIMKLIHEGHSYSEIAEDLGLKNEKVIRNLVYRINHPKENSLPKKRGIHKCCGIAPDTVVSSDPTADL